MDLVGFQNRLLVFIRWSFSFLTHGRGSRLITGEGAEAASASGEGGAASASGKREAASGGDESPSAANRSASA